MIASEELPPRQVQVVVVGSCNCDVVVRGGRLPTPGETVTALRMHRVAGGKGLNQAIAASRAGAQVVMIGAVGTDSAADIVLDAARHAGVRTDFIRVIRGTATGAAFVTVGTDGDNSISVIAGANAALNRLHSKERAEITRADVLLLQLETPVSVALEAATIARNSGTKVVLTPAPVMPLPAELWACVDLLLVNETEAMLLGSESRSNPALGLLARADQVIVTAGASGSYWADRSAGDGHIPARAVRAVDTTGAGDTFAGYLAEAMGGGASIVEAISRATLAAAIAVTREGSSDAIPEREEIDSFQNAQPSHL